MKPESEQLSLIIYTDELVEGTDEYRNIVRTIQRRIHQKNVPSENLTNSINTLLNAIGKSFATIDSTFGSFQLGQIEVDVAVGVNGKVSLIVGEVEGHYQSSLKFTFVRKT